MNNRMLVGPFNQFLKNIDQNSYEIMCTIMWLSQKSTKYLTLSPSCCYISPSVVTHGAAAFP